jgi:predicted unusual protein kinase regulating ubiquinone biosynthesis (AarF/ABC1/UbiB family)
MDFGMVMRVPPEMQQKLVKLLMTISEGQGEETAEVAISIGSPYDEDLFDADKFRHEIAQMVAKHQNLPLEQLHAGSIVMSIQAVAGEAGLRMPNEVTMLGKTLLNLDKVVDRLDPQFNPNEALRRHSTEIFQEHAAKRLSLGRLYHTLMETGEFIERLPERLNKISQLIANNELKVHVNAIDERRLITGIQKIANRITVGLILAALIIGASLLMRVETSFTIFGYPAIAMFFFVAAATMGLILAWQALFHDERQRPKSLK